MFLAIFG